MSFYTLTRILSSQICQKTRRPAVIPLKPFIWIGKRLIVKRKKNHAETFHKCELLWKKRSASSRHDLLVVQTKYKNFQTVAWHYSNTDWLLSQPFIWHFNDLTIAQKNLYTINSRHSPWLKRFSCHWTCCCCCCCRFISQRFISILWCHVGSVIIIIMSVDSCVCVCFFCLCVRISLQRQRSRAKFFNVVMKLGTSL